MTPSASIYRAFLIGIFLLFVVLEATVQAGNIMMGANLSPGFDMGVNTSSGRADWLVNEGGSIKMSYPSGQSWGAVFITVGKPKQPPRPFRDFSDFDTLTVEMKGDIGGERLAIGIKTNEQPDNGSETTIPVEITSTWRTHSFRLDKFHGANLKRLYVVIEFVFSGISAKTVYFRNVRYLKRSAAIETESSNGMGAGSPSRQEAESITPKVTISHPTDHYEIHSWSGIRPSILVRGTVSAIPQGSKMFLVTHPTHNDNAWANEIHLTGKDWISQAYLGGSHDFPRDGDTFEIFTTIRKAEQPLPFMFNLQNQPISHPSGVITVKVKVISWFDKVVVFLKDVPVSAPISALFTSIGLVIGSILGRKQTQNGNSNIKRTRKHKTLGAQDSRRRRGKA
jgi:hypothetical protein